MRRTALIFASIMALGVTGCSIDESTTPPAAERQQERFLQYGVAVPPHVEPSLPPPPYDSRVHGRPLQNEHPEWNEVLKPDFVLPRDPRRGPARSEENSLRSDVLASTLLTHEDLERGWWLNEGDGIYARNDAQRNFIIPASEAPTDVYAPTHMPPGRSCFESVTWHHRSSGANTTADYHAFWDWCTDSTFVVVENMDRDNWLNRYVRTIDGEERYYTQVYRTGGNCWIGLLFNYSQGVWEQKTNQRCGTNSFQSGWTFWEWNRGPHTCPSVASVEAVVNVLKDGIWYAVQNLSYGQLGPNGGCWTSGTYSFSELSVNHWRANTPNP